MKTGWQIVGPAGVAAALTLAGAAWAQTVPEAMDANAAASAPPGFSTPPPVQPSSLPTPGFNVPTTTVKSSRIGRKGRPVGGAAAGFAPVPTFPDIAPVKVKTIPLGANAAAPVPPYPLTPTRARPLEPLAPGPDWPTTRVRTLRLDGKGRVVEKADDAGSHR